MANREEALAKIQEIVAKQLNVEQEKITEDTHFVNDLGADSLDRVELVMAFEEEFDSEIPDEEAEKLETVKDAIDYLLKRADAA